MHVHVVAVALEELSYRTFAYSYAGGTVDSSLAFSARGTVKVRDRENDKRTSTYTKFVLSKLARGTRRGSLFVQVEVLLRFAYGSLEVLSRFAKEYGACS